MAEHRNRDFAASSLKSRLIDEVQIVTMKHRNLTLRLGPLHIEKHSCIGPDFQEILVKLEQEKREKRPGSNEKREMEREQIIEKCEKWKEETEIMNREREKEKEEQYNGNEEDKKKEKENWKEKEKETEQSYLRNTFFDLPTKHTTAS